MNPRVKSITIATAGGDPKALAYHAQPLPFRAARNAVQYSMVFHVPMQNMSYREDKQTAKLRSHISLLAVGKDADGQGAAKVSRDLANDILADKFEAFARGDLTLAQPPLLAPGRYTVETAVVDQENGAARVKRAALVVSDAARRSLRRPSRRRPESRRPVHFAGGKVTPSLDAVYPAGTPDPASHGGPSGPSGRRAAAFDQGSSGWEAGFNLLARVAASRPDRGHPRRAQHPARRRPVRHQSDGAARRVRRQPHGRAPRTMT
jgi:hypothetical protein